MTRPPRSVMSVLLSLCVVVLGSLVSTESADATPLCGTRWPRPVLVVHAPALIPENVAWDPTRCAFLVGSVISGTVSVVGTDGEVRTLVTASGMVSTFGLRVDTVRRRLLVAYSDPGMGSSSTSTTLRRLSGLGIFDLDTGRQLRRVDLSQPSGAHGANDLTLDPAGNAYVTDTLAGKIFRVDPLGRVTVVSADRRLLAPAGAVGLNGIAWIRGGYLVVARYDTGRLYRVPLWNPAHVTEVAIDRLVVGVDGIAALADGSLAVTTNSLASHGINSVAVLRSQDGWRTAFTAHSVHPWPDGSPTAVVQTPFGTYVLDGHLASVHPGPPADEFTLRRLRDS